MILFPVLDGLCMDGGGKDNQRRHGKRVAGEDVPIIAGCWWLHNGFAMPTLSSMMRIIVIQMVIHDLVKELNTRNPGPRGLDSHRYSLQPARMAVTSPKPGAVTCVTTSLMYVRL